MIIRNLVVSTLLLGYSAAAIGCSPPDEAVVATNDQVFHITKSRIESSDVIVDAVVVRNKRGEPILKPTKIWKGPIRTYYTVDNDGCGIFLPDHGQAIRVLLKRSGRNWSVIEPVIGSTKATLKFDGIVDGYLRNARPKNFKAVGPLLPPMP